MANKYSSGDFSFMSFVNFVGNNFIIIFLVGVFFLGGFFAGSLWTENQILKSGTRPTQQAADAGAGQAAQPTAPEGPSQEQLAKVPEVTDADHIRGSKDAKIVLIEYSDFECPFCKRFHPSMQQVLDEYGDDVAWVYRHYPLAFHASAQKAAEASECVAKIGGNEAFWQFTDLYYETTDGSGTGVKEDEMAALAAQVGVSEAAVQSCLDSDEMADKVQEQMSAGSTAGVAGTPGTILVTQDGEYELISGALPFAQVKQVIDQYL